MSAVNLDPSSRDSSESIGGRRPTGGIDSKDDRELDWPLKSADSFRKRLQRAHSERTVLIIQHDAERALEAARRAPRPTKQAEPQRGEPQWKRYVAECDLPSNELARKHAVSTRYINMVRQKYATAG